MLERKDFSQHVVARLGDAFHARERWFRGLWEVGVVHTLREILEGSEAAAHGVLSVAALKWLCDDATKMVLADEGVPKTMRNDLKACLSAPPGFESPSWFSLRDLIAEVDETYLDRWAGAAERASGSQQQPPKPERMGRAVAAHLLDLGLSQDFLSEWLTQELEAPSEWTLQDLVGAFHELARLAPITYRVLVPVTTGIRPHEAPKEFLQAPDVRNLLTRNNLGHRRLRYAGGWLLPLERRDPYSAAHSAFDEVDKRAARLLVGRGQRMASLDEVYVFGQPVPVAVTRGKIGGRIRIHSLERQQKLFAQATTSKIDAAFELLAQLEGSSGLAVAAGWAAIESMLAGPSGDKVMAADRLATLVAASFPRAELTSLAWQEMGKRSALGTRLTAMANNRERAEAIATAIKAGTALTIDNWSERAAVLRMQRLIAAPVEQLQDVREHVRRAFRRYYRQRNLVLHWGKTNPVALQACLRTGTPLLAAGVDRIAHAWFVQGIEPIPLATRAESRLDLAGRPGRKLTDLLEALK